MGSVDVPAAASETVWLDSNRFGEAEREYYEASVNESKQKRNPAPIGFQQEKPETSSCALDAKKQEQPVKVIAEKHGMSQSSLASEIACARQKIQNLIKSGDSAADISSGSLLNRMEKIEKEQNAMKREIEKLTTQLKDVLSELSTVRDVLKKTGTQSTSPVKKSETKDTVQNGTSAAPDDDLDLFGSEEETEDDARIKEERVKAYAEKKSKKPALVAKSSVVLDVKPWDDETDMKAMETAVRSVVSDGLIWGASKLVPLAYGIKKLQIVCIVEDDKVSIDWLQETIQDIEDLVQSVDIAAFNKL